METRSFIATDTLRAVIPGAEVRVYIPGTTTPVPVFNALGVEVAQPLVADSLGRVEVRTWNGAVDIAFAKGAATSTISAVQFYDPGAAPIRAFLTVAEAEAATIPAPVVRIDTVNFAALGDRGGASYIRAGAGPALDGWITTDGGAAFWKIDADEASPEQFGAPANGIDDDLFALDAIAGWQAATGGGIRLRSFVYMISGMWTLSHKDISVRSISGTGHNSGREHGSRRAVIQKMPGFSDPAAIKIDDGVEGCLLEGIYCNGGDFIENGAVYPGDDGAVGTYGAGDGFWIAQASTVNLVRCQAQNHFGYGFRFDGVWVLNTQWCISRKNGTRDYIGGNHTGGGILYTNEGPGVPRPEENANHTHIGWLCNGNAGHDVLADDGPLATDRANAIHWYGDQLESGNEYCLANVELRAGTRWTFDGSQFARGSGVFAPNVILGSATPGTSTVDVRFVSNYFQHHAPGPSFSVILHENVQLADFHSPRFPILRSKFINAEGASAINSKGSRPVINVIGGSIPGTHYRDPNGLINVCATGGITSGHRAAGLDESAYIGGTIPGQPTRFGSTSTNGTSRFVEMGSGPNENLMQIGAMFLALNGSAATPDPGGLSAGKLVLSFIDGTGDDPCGQGIGKKYLCFTIDGGATFHLIGAVI
jgi:hypothetical protein